MKEYPAMTLDAVLNLTDRQIDLLLKRQPAAPVKMTLAEAQALKARLQGNK